MSVRITAADKAVLLRAAALEHVNLTDFVVRHAVSIARQIIENDERQNLTEPNSLEVLELLDNPPPPNKRLMAAAFALAKQP